MKRPNRENYINKKSIAHLIADLEIYINYLKDKYDDSKIIKPRHVCDNCGSDNVHVKAWMRPNNNNEYIKSLEEGWCDDCQSNIDVSVEEMNVQNYVIGFQVIGTQFDSKDNIIMHPDITASFCIYSLPQANKMILDDKTKWSLVTIYDNNIKKPIMMFKGDPRKPDETIMNVLLKK